MPQTGSIPAARVDLDTIYRELTELRLDMVQLKADLPHHVTITKDKQEEYEARLANHGTRLGDVEHRATRLESLIQTQIARLETRVEVLEKERRPRAPWWVVVSTVAVIITTYYATITFTDPKP